MVEFFQQVVGGIETGSMYALAAMGLVLIYQTSKIINFAQGTLGMFNAYICTAFILQLGFPLYIAVPAAMVFAMVLGALIDRVLMNGRKHITALSREMISLALIIIFQGLAPMLFGANETSFSKFISASAVDIGGVKVLPNSFLVIGITFAIMVALFLILDKTKLGLAVRATAANPTTARLMGVPTKMVTMGAWAVATALGCLAAVMVAPLKNVTVSMMDSIHLNSFIAAVLGGFSTFYGPVVAAFIIGIANNLFGYYISTKWALPFLYALILLFIVLRPNGLFGKKIVKKV
ncbi:MAG TPA: branched-chain amino acid ABC transporter permease [Clostridia bacterium]|jgi:branched-chain amino acid transport system permease protein|nr:branched-chain amino acid ABC transporter permease [Clostridia bacterium]